MKSRLEQLEELLASTPKDSFLLFAIAKEHEKVNNYQRAEEYYVNLYNSNKDYIGLYYHYAQLLGDTGRLDQAIKIYDEGIQIAKQQNDFHSLSELMNAKTNLLME